MTIRISHSICLVKIGNALEEIVFMGGCIGLGNITPGSEFNIMNDPDAAHIVVTSARVTRLAMIPLEVTHTVCVTTQITERLRAMNSSFSSTLDRLLHFFASTYKEVFKFDCPPLHDPCAVAYVAERDLFDMQHMHVDIERRSDYCQGRTVCDVYDMHRKVKNCHVAMKITNIEHFWNMMLTAIEQANRRSPMNESIDR
jgi:inosine-uridine nucleoside N-ribohydrolase